MREEKWKKEGGEVGKGGQERGRKVGKDGGKERADLW